MNQDSVFAVSLPRALLRDAASFAALLSVLSSESESESEMFLFDPYKKYIQSTNETILDQGTPIKTSLVANIRAAYYIIGPKQFFSYHKLIIHNKVIHDHARMSL